MTRVEFGKDPKDKKKKKDETLGEPAGGAHTRGGIERIETEVSDTPQEPLTERQKRKIRKKI